jgi:hypothetical protein
MQVEVGHVQDVRGKQGAANGKRDHAQTDDVGWEHPVWMQVEDRRRELGEPAQPGEVLPLCVVVRGFLLELAFVAVLPVWDQLRKRDSGLLGPQATAGR